MMPSTRQNSGKEAKTVEAGCTPDVWRGAKAPAGTIVAAVTMVCSNGTVLRLSHGKQQMIGAACTWSRTEDSRHVDVSHVTPLNHCAGSPVGS